MKNLKIRSALQSKIATGVMSVVLAVGTFAGGIFAEKKNSEYQAEKNKKNKADIVQEVTNELNGKLNMYEDKRLKLGEEINKLLEEKEQLQNNETFDIKDLIVMEYTDENGYSDLYILKHRSAGIYEEYHGEFQAWYKLHEYTEEHVHDFCPTYVHFDEGNPLFDYLSPATKEYIGKNNGKITTLVLDELLESFRDSYHYQLEESESSKSYVKS